MMRRKPVTPRPGDLVIAGIDCEYVTEAGGNRILSYQWYLLAGEKASSGIVYVDGRRLKFADLLQRVLGAAKAEGLFDRYPKTVTVAAHFSLAELVAMADFMALKKRFDQIRRTFVSVKRPVVVRIRDRNGNPRKVAVFLRDTMLLTPQGAGLAALGEMHGLPKITLPEGAIEHMDQLLRDNPGLFEKYAIRDAEIAARHAAKMANLNHELNGACMVPISLGGMAIDFTLALWSAKGIKALDVLGQEVVQVHTFDERRQRLRKSKNTVLRAGLYEHETLAGESYHGGRNEALYFGATELGDWLDIDLAGAYTTALAMLGFPLWDQLTITLNVDDYTPDVLGFARIEFRFPSDVRFPCFPVRALNNLVYPLSGVTYATATEIWLARRLGARIKILHGVVVPMNREIRPFLDVIKEATARRSAAKAAGNILLATLYKETANSLYGKTAQGLRKKRALDTRSGKTKEMPPSKLTNAFVAAAVTGTVRAVLGEIMNDVPRNRTIVSVTTDGCITDSTREELAGMQDGPLCRLFRVARVELTGDSTIVEIKHEARQVLCWRTRGQATIEAAPEQPIILAKAGFKPPRGMDKGVQNSLMLQFFCEREITTTYEFKNLRPLSKIYREGGDLVSEEFLRRLKMDFDWKRRPIHPGTVEINGYPHLCFATAPWDNVEEFVRCREQWRRFQGETGRCLKTTGDLEAFLEFAAQVGLNTAGLNRSVKSGSVGPAIRQFLRAFTRGEWGLSADAMTYADLVAFLRRGGFAVTVNDVKNASRTKAKLVEGAVPATGAVVKFIEYVKIRFPGFQDHRMLSDQVAKPTQKAKSAYQNREANQNTSSSTKKSCTNGVLPPPWVCPRPESTPPALY